MGTVSQAKPQSNPERQPRWDCFERADLFEYYLELQAQGVSQRQAAQELQVWRAAQTLISCFYTAFDPRLVTWALVQLNGDIFFFYNKSLGDLNVEKFTHQTPSKS